MLDGLAGSVWLRVGGLVEDAPGRRGLPLSRCQIFDVHTAQGAGRFETKDTAIKR